MKKIIVSVFVLILILSGCGEKKDIATGTTAADTITTRTITKTTTTTVSKEEKGSNSGTGQTLFEKADLTEDFEAKFASFKVSENWEFMTGSINETDDTLYFYFNQVREAPFFMYQYEKAELSPEVFSSEQWDTVFQNVGIRRVGEEIRNGIRFQYGFSDNFNDNYEFHLYYTFEKGVLQGFALVIPQVTEQERQEYMERFADILDTVVIKQEAVEHAFDNVGSDISATTAASPSTSGVGTDIPLPTELDPVVIDNVKFAVPKGWSEISRNETGGLTVGYAENSSTLRGILFQKIEIGALLPSQVEQIWNSYVSGLGAENGGTTTINGQDYVAILPPAVEGELNFVGYATYRDGMVYSFLFSYHKDYSSDAYAGIIRKIVEAVEFR